MDCIWGLCIFLGLCFCRLCLLYRGRIFCGGLLCILLGGCLVLLILVIRLVMVIVDEERQSDRYLSIQDLYKITMYHQFDRKLGIFYW